MPKDSILKTFTVAAGLCIVCSIIVSVTAQSLKSRQEANKQLDKQITILRAAGLIDVQQKPSSAQVNDLFKKVDSVIYDFQTGELLSTDKPDTTLMPLDAEKDIAGLKGEIPKETTVYLVKENEQLQTVVLPIYGQGLWSTMRGFISLQSDLSTIKNITFYDHGETPGLGGEISNPKWTEKWTGKKAFNADNAPAVHVIKGNVDPNSPTANIEIDGISGATLTGNGVTKTVTFWLGENGFGPFLQKLVSQRSESDL